MYIFYERKTNFKIIFAHFIDTEFTPHVQIIETPHSSKSSQPSNINEDEDGDSDGM